MLWKNGKTGFHGVEVFPKLASMAWNFLRRKEKRRLPGPGFVRAKPGGHKRDDPEARHAHGRDEARSRKRLYYC